MYKIRTITKLWVIALLIGLPLLTAGVALIDLLLVAIGSIATIVGTTALLVDDLLS